MKKTLTADLCAVAIIASARSLGVDPIFACRADATPHGRRALVAAGSVLAQVTGTSHIRVSDCLGLAASSIRNAESRGGDDFFRAITQTLLAVSGAAAALAPSGPELEPTLTIEGEFRVLESPVLISATLAAAPAPKAPQVKPRAAKRPIPISVGPSSKAIPSSGLPASKRDKVPEVFQRIWAEAAPPAPKSSTIRASDRALIDAAVAAGKVKVAPTAIAEGGGILGLAIADHPEPLTYDKVTRHYRRAT